MRNKKSLTLPPPRSPIHFGPVSNGEYLPRAANPRDALAERLVHRIAAVQARRLGVDRRTFLASPCGMAAALLVINHLGGCGGSSGGGVALDAMLDLGPGADLGGGGAEVDGGPEIASDGGYEVTPEMLCDPDAARAVLSGDQFVFDVQTHHVDASEDAPWLANNLGFKLLFDYFAAGLDCPEKDYRCFSQQAYIHEVFVKSDTTVAALTGVPAMDAANPLTNAQIASTRELVDQLAGSQRMVSHAMVLPDLGGAALDGMQALFEAHGPSAWKVYTPWTAQGGGWWLDDPAVGLPFLQQAQDLGVGIICAHKGIPLPGFSEVHASPKDVGPAALAFPDLQIVVYHSAWDADFAEGPYDPQGGGIDRLVKTLEASGIAPNENVWAELGGAWHSLMTRPTEAAHALGKLLKHVGEDRVLWGTDCIWFGSPQPQIEAFRAFQIPESLQEAHAYPALTAEVKAKVLGLNAASLYGIDPEATRCSLRGDWIDARRAATAAAGLPAQLTPAVYGPTSRRQFFAMLARRGGKPA